jgi:5'(3')-deoxyribonucleotidase
VKLAIDIDNVVLEWQYHWPELYRQWFDREIPAAALDSWDACIDQTHFETMGDFYVWFDRADGWATQPYVPGAQGFLWAVRHVHHFEFVTSRPDAGEAGAAFLAGRWGTHVSFKGNRSKHLVKADLWIDDSPEVLTSLVENGKRAVRFDRPWNRKLPKKVESKLLVASNWAEVANLVDTVAQEEGL